MEEQLKEMLGKRPDELEGETLKLFEAIMKIADERDELKARNKELEEENRIQRGQLNSAFDRGFIHKDKLREKAEEYKGQGYIEIAGALEMLYENY